MKSFFIKLILVIFVLIVTFQLSGCGETFHGVGKDVQRVGKGVKTIFIRDGE